MRRAITSRSWDERGVTVVELMVTLAVMGVIVAAAMGVLFRVYSDTGIIENRRDVLADGRLALQQMTKGIRQATVLNSYVGGVGDPTKMDMETFFGADGSGDPSSIPTTHIIWRTTGSAAPYGLELSMDGGTSYRPILSNLRSPNIFTYVTHDNGLVQISVAIALGTKTTVVNLTADVELRNLGGGGTA